MNVAQKEELIIKLNDERRRIIIYLKQKIENPYRKRLEKRLEEINKEIEGLIYGNN